MKLKYLRQSRFLTLKDLSKKTGISYSYLSKIENGYANCSDEQYAKIKKVLGEDFELEPIANFVRENEKLRKENSILKETISNLIKDKEHLYKYINNLKKYMIKVRNRIDVFNNLQ